MVEDNKFSVKEVEKGLEELTKKAESGMLGGGGGPSGGGGKSGGNKGVSQQQANFNKMVED